MKDNIPISLKQVLFIGLIFALPIAFAAVVFFGLPGVDNTSESELWFGAGLLIVSGIISVVVCSSLIVRRSVELTSDCILVKHKFYTIRVQRHDVESLTVTRIGDIRDLGISTRRNGIAAFGFYSGWFNAEYGDLIFLAISVRPVLVIRLSGHPRCSAIALSCTTAIEAEITAWASRGISMGE